MLDFYVNYKTNNLINAKLVLFSCLSNKSSSFLITKLNYKVPEYSSSVPIGGRSSRPPAEREA